MIFYITIVGGLGIGSLLTIISHRLGYNIMELNPLLNYILPFIPVFIYILYKGNGAMRRNSEAFEKGLFGKVTDGVKINNPTLGRYNIFTATVLVILATLCAIILMEPLNSIIPMPEYLKRVYGLMLTDPLWSTLSVAVAAPLIEEFLLRGVMMRGMLQHTTPTNAIMSSAFFFAVIHMNPYQAAGAFIMGIFLGWIYYKSGILWLSILVHALNNGLSTLFTHLFPEMSPDSGVIDLVVESCGIGCYLILYAISAILLATVIYCLNKNLNNEEKQETLSI